MLTITLQEVLSKMREVDHKKQPIPFSIQAVKADKRRGRYGEILSLTGCIKRSSTIDKAAMKREDSLKKINASETLKEKSSTINIYQVETKRVIKIHVRLITAFNDLKVIY